MGKLKYIVHVLQGVTAWEDIEVEAESEEEAREIAVQEFEFDWCQSQVEFETATVLSMSEPGLVLPSGNDGAHEFKFSPGRLAVTPGVRDLLPPEEVGRALARHVRGDWGDVPAEDSQENERSLETGGRLMSVYRSEKGEVFWIITEADRSVTTLLLPSEY
jgi:hypothetical protein